MAKGTKKTTAKQRSRIGIGWLVTALLIANAITLGLKAWDEHQTNTQAALTHTHLTSLAGKEYVDGKAEKVRSLLQNSTKSAHPDLIQQYAEIDTIVPLAVARNNSPGSRLRTAAERIMLDKDKGGVLFTTTSGDIIILASENGQDILSLGKAEAWLPTASADYRFSLTGPGHPSRGNEALAKLSTGLAKGQPKILSHNGFPRTGVACVPLRSGAMAFCTLKPQPLFTQDEMILWLIYALLLLAPALAIYGLYARLTGQTKQIEKALKTERDATHLINLTMEGARAGFWESKSDTSTLTISDQLAQLIGHSTGEDIELAKFLGYVHEQDREAVKTAFTRSEETRVLNVAFRTKKDGDRKWLELSGREVKDHDGTYIHFAGIASDITERKAIDDRLTMTERRLRNALEGYNGPFAIWDQRKRLLYWNSAYARTFNLSIDLREGMSYDTVKLAASTAIRQETPSDSEANTALIHLTTGRWIKLVERVTPEGGRISVGVDMTETTLGAKQLTRQKQKLKRLVAELERSEGHAAGLARKYAAEKERAEHAANSKSAFLANMSHELRTPLNAINGFSEILTSELYGPLGDARYKGYANDILMSGQHLLDMINDILDMAKIEAGKMSIQRQYIDPVDPVDAAIRMIRRKAEDAGIQLILDAEENLPEINADHRAIRQMILNLISNAIKFTDKGGRIAVTIRHRENVMRFAVTDSGVGIPEEDLPRLAKPFEQVNDNSNRNHEGTGLGLALTKSFAEMHGGKLTIASKVGRGTTVAFYLPVKAKPQADVQIPA